MEEDIKFVSYDRKQRKQIRTDRKRIFRVVEHFDFPCVIDVSPVQLSDGYVIADTETHELFASFIFQNLSEKEISRLHIRLLLFRDMDNVPYIKLPFTYSYENLSFGIRSMPGEEEKRRGKKRESKNIRVTEFFGNASYIKLPESYFKKIKLELMAVEFADGSSAELGIIVSNNAKRFSEFDDEKRYAYHKFNIYSEAEQYFPTRLVPQVTEQAWLCCCGSKNLISSSVCPRCGRDREWQMANINEENLSSEVTTLKRENDKMLQDKTHFKGYEKEATEEEKLQKMREYEKVLRRVAEEERRKEHNKNMIFPKILLFFGVALLILYILQYLLE